jgi:hypothetical protein
MKKAIKKDYKTIKKDSDATVNNYYQELSTDFEKQPDNIGAIAIKEASQLLNNYQYSTYNQVLLLCQGSTAAKGFHEWKKYERTVKKGANAVYLYAPRFKDDEIKGFILAPVFDIEDTEGRDYEELKENTTQAQIKKILKLTTRLDPISQILIGYSIGNNRDVIMDNYSNVIAEYIYKDPINKIKEAIKIASLEMQKMQKLGYII